MQHHLAGLRMSRMNDKIPDRAVLPQPGAELEQLPGVPPQDELLSLGVHHGGLQVGLQPRGLQRHLVEQALVRLRPQQEDRRVLRGQAGGQGQGRDLLPGMSSLKHECSVE